MLRVSELDASRCRRSPAVLYADMQRITLSLGWHRRRYCAAGSTPFRRAAMVLRYNSTFSPNRTTTRPDTRLFHAHIDRDRGGIADQRHTGRARSDVSVPSCTAPAPGFAAPAAACRYQQIGNSLADAQQPFLITLVAHVRQIATCCRRGEIGKRRNNGRTSRSTDSRCPAAHARWLWRISVL